MPADKSTDYKSEVSLAVALTELLRGRAAPLTRPLLLLWLWSGIGSDRQRRSLFRIRVLLRRELGRAKLIKFCSQAGAFLESHAGLSNYAVKQVRDCLVSARVSVPKNLSLAFLRAAQRGWMMDIPGTNGRGKVWL